MNILAPHATDDPAFIKLVECVISSLDRKLDPEDVFVIEVKNWFDHKWLNYSGRTLVPFPVRGVGMPSSGVFPSRIHTALTDSYQEQITFPPFNRHRIISQDCWSHDSSSLAPLIHRKRRRHSCWNLHRRVVDFADSAFFVWFSSGTLINDQASLMMYSVSNRKVETWYVSLKKSDTWTVYRTKGITPDAFDSYAHTPTHQLA